MSNQTIHIAVDLMGGDSGPSAFLPAVERALAKNASLSITVFLTQGYLPSAVLTSLQSTFADRLQVVECEDQIEVSDKPSAALRNKQNASMYKAMQMVADNRAEACVSAGNTGALMAIGCFLLKTFPGIDRPAICTEVPNEATGCYLLDIGANVDSRSEHLLQFAMMGSVALTALKNIQAPRIGLLNIGEESVKGNEQVRLAAMLLQQNNSLNYLGYVEGNDVYSGKADVVVCDGFVGNILIKSSEGVVRYFVKQIDAVVRKHWLLRMLPVLVRPILQLIRKQLNPSRYNGASLLGLTKTVVVSHGSADSEGFYRAIDKAYCEVKLQVPEKINQGLAQLSEIAG